MTDMAVRRIKSSGTEGSITAKRKQKISPFLIGIIILLLLLVFFWYKTKSWPIVAMVGMHPVTRFEAAQVLFKQGGKTVVDDIVTQILINNELKKNNIKVTDEEINAKLEEIKNSLNEGTTLDDALAANGLTLEELKKQLRLRIGIEKILADKIAVTDEEVNNYFLQDSSLISSATDEAQRTNTREMLKINKLQTEANTWISDLKSKTKIWEFSGF
jgi:parvulin-like peptidyl-prolyl isomerase